MIEGAIHSGEELILIQEGFRLHVKNLEWFNSAAGASAYLTVRVIEVLEGKLPSHLEELILNANGWEIYRADDPSIPELVNFYAYGRIIGGLEILKNYGADADYIVAEHDEIFAGPSPSEVSEAHLKELADLGWRPSDAGNFSIFV